MISTVDYVSVVGIIVVGYVALANNDESVTVVALIIIFLLIFLHIFARKRIR